MSYDHSVSVQLSAINPAQDADELVRFLSSNRFPFHVRERPSEVEARSRLTNGAFDPPDNLAYWIELAGNRVGFLNFQELSEGTPMIDLRLGEADRGRGLGSVALELGVAEIFKANPDVNRVEGNTRADNIAMRKVFQRTGFVKEAHYREGWTVADSAPLDSVAYAILRRDWQTGASTPINWDA